MFYHNTDLENNPNPRPRTLQYKRLRRRWILAFLLAGILLLLRYPPRISPHNSLIIKINYHHSRPLQDTLQSIPPDPPQLSQDGIAGMIEVQERGPSRVGYERLSWAAGGWEGSESVGASGTKYLSYEPHSGLHNQRIALQNAFKLAKLLNRTLVVPSLRLGRAVQWAPSGALGARLAEDERKYARRPRCTRPTALPDALPDVEERDQCLYDASWTAVPARYLLDFAALAAQVPVLDRPDLRPDWLWHTLRLAPGDWVHVRDQARYSYQIYDHSASPDHPSLADKYQWRLNLADLAPWNATKLLTFGSLFASDRLVLSQPDIRPWADAVLRNQAPNLPLLETISDLAIAPLGGRGAYIGLHLRLGNASFKRRAAQVVRDSFVEICRTILKVDQEAIDDMISAHERRRAKAAEAEGLSEVGASEGRSARGPGGKRGHEEEGAGRGEEEGPQKPTCRGKLHAGRLERLNAAVYLSTDVASHPDLALFTAHFPCLWTFHDLAIADPGPGREAGHPALAAFFRLRSPRDGLLLAPFLTPLLEAIIVAKGSHILGTPGSTFSTYLLQFLHPYYHAQLGPL